MQAAIAGPAKNLRSKETEGFGVEVIRARLHLLIKKAETHLFWFSWRLLIIVDSLPTKMWGLQVSFLVEEKSVKQTYCVCLRWDRGG